MTRNVFLMMCLMVSGATLAQPVSPSPAEKDEVIAIVREAMRNDPSILREALEALRANDEAQRSREFSSTVAKERDRLFSDPSDGVIGSPTAPVTIVEFYDTRCPFCRSMVPVVESLVRDGSIRVVFKDLPILGAQSVLEAKALLAAQRQGKYQVLMDAIMHSSTPASDDSLQKMAAECGLDAVSLKKEMSSLDVTRKISENTELARELDIDGTPGFLVGGRLLKGAQTEEDFRTVVKSVKSIQ